MADETPTAAASAPPIAVDPQDPIPESNFKYRRIFAFVFCSWCLAQVGWNSYQISLVALKGSETAIKGLVNNTWWTLALCGLIVTYYLLAPSAEQMTKMIQTARLLKGSTFTSTSRAASSDGSASSTTTVTPAAEPAAPPPPPVEEDEVDAAPSSRPA